MYKIGNDWDILLESEFSKEYYKKLEAYLETEYEYKKIHPEQAEIYSAFRETSYKDTKVVILGQDPYHGEGQAHGMAFSVKAGVKIPPSLRNIYKELVQDVGIKMPETGFLMPWAKQGVLLLNTVLTVRDGSANSHKGKGFEVLTDEVIKILNNKDEPVVFMLWGANARAKVKFIKNNKHLILESVHPSPLSAHGGFFGCKHFSKANAFLKEQYGKEISWGI